MKLRVWALGTFIGLISVSCAKFELDKTNGSVTALSSRAVTVKWAASKEKAVNSVGGGYKVTYGLGNIDSNSTSIDIPFQSSATFLPQASIKFPGPGTYKVRITAYSALNTQGSSTEVTTNVQ